MNLFDGLDLSKNVTNFKSGVENLMRDVRTNSLTPADVTTKNMSDGVALKTSNDTAVEGTITSYRSTAVDQLNGIIGSMSGGLLNFKNITKAVRMGRDGVTFDVGDILGTVSSEMGYQINSGGGRGMNGAMQKIARDLSGEFNRITGLNLGQILTTDGSKFAVNRNWRGMVGNETFKLLTRYGGIDEYIDVSVQAALYSTIMKQAASLGMRDAYSRIYRQYPSGMARYARDAVLEAISEMITNGDILSVKAVADLLDKEGKSVILSKYPNLVEKIFSSFRFDDDVTPEDYPELRKVILDLLNDLIGPRWYYRQTEFGPALDLAVINTAGKDMVTLLSGVDELVPLLCTAGVFREYPATMELRKQFPTAAKFDF